MDWDSDVTRRQCMQRLLAVSGGLALGGIVRWPEGLTRKAWAAADRGKFLVEAVAGEPAVSVRDLTRKTFEAVGGMGRFVSKGDVVVVKPNISWARAANLGATTHPEVMEAVVELCQEAGAKKVRIVDNTIHDAARCFALSGAGAVAKKTGADLVHPRASLMRDMKIGGSRLDVWPVFVPVVEADKVINLPVAKHHSLTSLTLGMKNWIGAVGGSRWSLHQDIHQTVVDLAQFFNPAVTLIDATRIMVRNGPSGGSLSDVVAKNTLILSDDPVAGDARAASLLFGQKPENLGFVVLAEKGGLGTMDMEKLQWKKVSL